VVEQKTKVKICVHVFDLLDHCQQVVVIEERCCFESSAELQILLHLNCHLLHREVVLDFLNVWNLFARCDDRLRRY